MRNPLQSDVSVGFGLLASRLALGVTLALAGIHKFVAEGGVSYYVTSNLSNLPSYVPMEIGQKFLSVVPSAELAMGVLLGLGLLSRIASFLSILLLGAFILIGGLVDRNYIDPMYFLTEPTKYACLSLVTLFAGPGMFSIDRLLMGGPANRSNT